MPSGSLGYVIAVINQASGQVEDTLASEILHEDLESAEFERECAEQEQGARCDRYIVCEVFEVS